MSEARREELDMSSVSRRAWVVAVFALILFAILGVLVHQEPPLGVDRAAFDVLDPLRGEGGQEIVRVLTDLGSFPVAALVTALGALYVARTRGPATALGLFVALAAALILVNVGKELTDRARPTDRFYDPSGLSYPSGHSTYVTAWLAVAGLTGRRALIAIAAALVLAVGASRLYLHVHHLTDVLGGFAVGAAVFAGLFARR